MSEWIAGEAIADAVNVANDLRQKFGIDVINDLPQSTPENEHNCVLANAFNFDCRVESGNNTAWGVHFEKENKAQAEYLAKVLNTELNVYTELGTLSTEEYEKELEWEAEAEGEDVSVDEIRAAFPIINYEVDLPEKIGEIARKFDDLYLDPKYYIDEELAERAEKNIQEYAING
jgi:hypothetical protein